MTDATKEPTARDTLIADAVNRFLGWELPKDFYPDAGISFKQLTNPAWTHDTWPTGTNLFHAGQAKAMFEHCIPSHLHVDGEQETQGVVPVKRWPFVESPGDFAVRLSEALNHFSLLAAVRNVMIENPPALAADYLIAALPGKRALPSEGGMERALDWLLGAVGGKPGSTEHLSSIKEAIAAYDPDRMARCGNTVSAGLQEVRAWVVSNGQGDKWRMWGDSGPEWTEDREKALQFARRGDAESFSRDDEDAWLIQPLHDLELGR